MNKRAVSILAYGHFANDFLVNIFTTILPLLTVQFHLSYVDVGILTMASNVASSLVQPLFGYLSDKKGAPWMLGLSAIVLSLGLLSVVFAPSFIWLIPAVVLNGMGSAAFHPDASRAVYFAAGNRRGFAQSVFQVGGNLGLAVSALALWLLNSTGMNGIAWFMVPGALSTVLLFSLMKWFARRLTEYKAYRSQPATSGVHQPTNTSKAGLSFLVFIVTIRSWIVSGFMTFVPLYLIHDFGVLEKNVWPYSFVFLLFGAIGTLAGGPLADRFGQRNVIRTSMIVSTPLAVLLPYLPEQFILFDLGAVGFFLLSTFAVTVVFGQEMLPGNIAMVSGLLIGFAGGIAGIGIMCMGMVADAHGLRLALEWIVWMMPLAAISTFLLPIDSIRRTKLQVKPSGEVYS